MKPARTPETDPASDAKLYAELSAQIAAGALGRILDRIDTIPPSVLLHTDRRGHTLFDQLMAKDEERRGNNNHKMYAILETMLTRAPALAERANIQSWTRQKGEAGLKIFSGWAAQFVAYPKLSHYAYQHGCVIDVHALSMLLKARNYELVAAYIHRLPSLRFHNNRATISFLKDAAHQPTVKAAFLARLDAFYAAMPPDEKAREAKQFLIDYTDSTDAYDMLLDMTRRVVIPSYSLMQQPHAAAAIPPVGHLETMALETATVRAFVASFFRPDMPLSEAIGRIDALSHSWHHPANQFSTEGFTTPENITLPVDFRRHWAPLMPHPFPTRSGHGIVCLTDSTALQHEHYQLGHCIDTYVQSSCNAKSHILSIRDAAGKSLSTLEVQLVPLAERKTTDHPIANEPYALRVLQHEGLKIRGVADKITSGPLHDDLQEWLDALASGAVRLQTQELGETAESIRKMQHVPSVILESGYYPSRENIDRAFQQFKRGMRRAATETDADNQLVYAEPAQHFIDGTATQDGLAYPLRHMSAREWMRATRLENVMRLLLLERQPHVAAKLRPEWEREDGRLSATLPPPTSHADRQRRAAYASNQQLAKRERSGAGQFVR